MVCISIHEGLILTNALGLNGVQVYSKSPYVTPAPMFLARSHTNVCSRYLLLWIGRPEGVTGCSGKPGMASMPICGDGGWWLVWARTGMPTIMHLSYYLRKKLYLSVIVITFINGAFKTVAGMAPYQRSCTNILHTHSETSLPDRCGIELGSSDVSATLKHKQLWTV